MQVGDRTLLAESEERWRIGARWGRKATSEEGTCGLVEHQGMLFMIPCKMGDSMISWLSMNELLFTLRVTWSCTVLHKEVCWRHGFAGPLSFARSKPNKAGLQAIGPLGLVHLGLFKFWAGDGPVFELAIGLYLSWKWAYKNMGLGPINANDRKNKR